MGWVMTTDKHYLWHMAGAKEWKVPWLAHRGKGQGKVRNGWGYGYLDGAGADFLYNDTEGGYEFDIGYWERNDYG